MESGRHAGPSPCSLPHSKLLNHEMTEAQCLPKALGSSAQGGSTLPACREASQGQFASPTSPKRTAKQKPEHKQEALARSPHRHSAPL